MLEYPKNYEEAKIIIKNSVGGPVSEHTKKLNILRSTFITLLGIGAAVTLGIVKKDMAFTAASLPFFGAISATSFYPLFFKMKVDKSIKNETYFEGKSEEQIINIARAHVDEYNKIQSRNR